MKRAVAALGLATFIALAPAVGAHADAAVTITGGADVPTTGQTQLTVTGAGFQSVPGGFGGIYVMFGWVDPAGTWRPSQGGVTGTSYRYAADDEQAPVGFQRFLAFPGSSTAAEASGQLGADGTFSTTITTPGPVFTSLDRNRVETRVDCLTVQCGIITIGAHGVVNPTNETFTPVTFAAPSASATPSPSVTASPSASPSAIAADNTTFASSAPVPVIVGAVFLLALVTAGLLLWRRLTTSHRE